MIQLSPMFTPTVGVAPGTTTIATQASNGLACSSCAHPVAGLGVCPPGHYGPAIMLPGSSPQQVTPKGDLVATYYNPYATESRLSGLRGASPRLGLFALMLGLGFVGVIGAALLLKRK